MDGPDSEFLMAAATETRRGAQRLARRLRVERAPGTLSANKIGVLALLARNGPSTPGEISSAERQRPQSLTRIFAELEAEGMVTRSRGEHDRRESVLTITEAGIDLVTRDMAHRDRWLAAAIAELSDTEINVLRIAGRLMDRLADATPIIPSDPEDRP